MSDRKSPRRGGEWVARIARTVGAFLGAAWLGMVLASLDVVGALTPSAVPQGPAGALVAGAAGLVIGAPVAFAIVLALDWNERLPLWPLAGFILGSEVVSGLLFVAVRVDGVGAPSQPDLAWWAACTSALVIGAFAALGTIQRRRARATLGSSGLPLALDS